MKKLLLVLCALLAGVSGVKATDVTVIKSTSDATTYGTLSGSKFTTNDASGMAGVTVDGIISTTATSFAYGACLGLTSTQNGTITMTAPDGYVITGYKLTARSNTYAVPYTLTPSAGGSAVVSSTGGVELETSGLSEQTASFTYSASSANSFYIPSLVISVIDASVPTVNVTYELYEADGTTLVSSVSSVQEANSAVSIPNSLTVYTYYDYVATGTIGDADCTIKVTRTKKSGVVLSTNDLSNAKCYNIRNNRGTWAVGSGATDVNSTVELNLAFSATDTKQQFAIIEYEGKYYLYSVGESKFAYVDGTKLSLTSKVTSDVANSPVTFTSSTAASAKDEPVIVTIGGGMFGVSTGKSPDVFKYNVQNDGGNSALILEAGEFDPTIALEALDTYFNPSYFVTYVVKDAADNKTLYTSKPVGTTLGANITTLPEDYQLNVFYTYNTVDVTISEANTTVEFTATLKDKPLFKFTADATTPVWYALKLKDANYPTYVADGTPNVTLPTTNANDETVQWAFIGNPYAGFQIVNRAAGTGLVLGSASAAGDGADGGSTYATLAAAGTQTNELWFAYGSSYLTNGFFLFNGEGHALNQRSTENLAYWASGYDKGSTFTAEEVLEGKALYDEMIAELEAINYGKELGQYTLTGDLAGYAGNEAALIAMIKSTYGDAANYTGGVEAIQNVLDATVINVPYKPSFLRMRSILGDKAYLKAVDGGSRMTMTTTADKETIFLYNGNSKLISYSKGLAINNVREIGTVGEEGNSFSFIPALNGEAGKYSIITEYKGNNHYLYSTGMDGSNADRNTLASQFYNQNSWTLEAVTELPVAVTSVGYATLYAPVALTIPAGVEAFYVSAIAEGEATLTPLENTIPANTGVILKAAEGTYNFAIAASVDAVANKLAGTVAAKAWTNEYTLQNSDAGVGLFQKEVAQLAGFKAYLPAENVPANVKGLTFDFETAIRAIEAAKNSENIFDLSGRRVQKAVKGLYIVNGKKVVIK